MATEKEDVVKFGNNDYSIPQGHSEEEVREVFEQIHPAISHASLTKVARADGTHEWKFAETAGTKGS